MIKIILKEENDISRSSDSDAYDLILQRLRFLGARIYLNSAKIFD